MSAGGPARRRLPGRGTAGRGPRVEGRVSTDFHPGTMLRWKRPGGAGIGLRKEIAGVEQGLRAEIAGVEQGLRAEIAGVKEQMRTHFDVAAESLHHDIQLAAEAVAALAERDRE